MKVLFCTVREGNFGDDLNRFLWEKLLPHRIKLNSSEAILGIGTLQGTKLPNDVSAVHVLGSGSHGEHPGSWHLSSKLKVHFVRGPRTAKLWACEGKDVTDGAILLRNLDLFQLPDSKVSGRVGFVPHHKSDRLADYESICKNLGLHYISPRSGDPQGFISEVRTCERIITEALHGAVLADLCRIPWLSICSAPYINEFKWHDWSESVGVSYDPIRTSFLCTRGLSSKVRFENLIKRGLNLAGIGKERWEKKRVFFDNQSAVDKASNDLLSIVKSDRWIISSDYKFSTILERSNIAWESFLKQVS